MKTTIELNGRMYDTATGKLLGKTAVPTTPQKAPQAPGSGAFLDGIRRRKVFKKNEPVIQNKAEIPDHTNHSSIFKPRTFLKSPQNDPQDKTHLQNLGLLRRVHETKQLKAAKTPIDKKVARFGMPVYHKPKLTSSYPVANPPQLTAKHIAPALNKKKRLFHKRPKEEVFIHHILKANIHAAPKLKKPKVYTRIAKTLKIQPKVLGASAACLAVLLLTGFLAYQNIPSVAMRVAASRAGFNGHLPDNTPVGFSFKGPILFTKGAITLSYKSNSDSRNFAITQKPTDWTSETLLTDFLVASGLQYQTFHDKGLTVYIYNEGSATWVDKGVWYSVSSSGALSSDQILAIAGSM